MSKQAIKKAEEIIASQTVKNGTFNGEFCSLVLLDREGYPTASVLTAAASDGIKHVYFCTDTDSNKYKRAKASPKASVHYGTGEHSMTLVGEIEMLLRQNFGMTGWRSIFRKVQLIQTTLCLNLQQSDICCLWIVKKLKELFNGCKYF